MELEDLLRSLEERIEHLEAARDAVKKAIALEKPYSRKKHRPSDAGIERIRAAQTKRWQDLRHAQRVAEKHKHPKP